VLLPLSEIRLRGSHNLENVRAAALAATDMDVPAEAIRQALRSFAGVPHRLEEVATVDGVLFVNDSKATNVASAAKAVESFAESVHVILGGSLKGRDFTDLREPLRTHAAAAYLIGDAAERLADDLDGTVQLHHCGTLKEAVREAASAAQRGQVVLLSPACASFDAFRDYEDRGDRFRELATALG
jgi:UDP-N-acetylmuramoylalanine--D-glutamate ligase